MKKTLSVLLVFVMLFAVVSGTVGCSHEHKFVLSEADSKLVSCTEDGIEVKVCSCGAKQEQVIPMTGHDWKLAMESKPTCTGTGMADYKCTKCGKMKYTNIEALGHAYEETASEPSRVRRCLNEGCTSCVWGESGDKHKEVLTFSFTKEDEAAIDAKFDEVKGMIEAAPKYDPALHGYAETGALAEEYAIVEAATTSCTI